MGYTHIEADLETFKQLIRKRDEKLFYLFSYIIYFFHFFFIYCERSLSLQGGGNKKINHYGK